MDFSVVSLIAALVSIALTVYLRGVEWGKLETRIQHLEKLERRIIEIDKSVTELKLQITPFWALIERNLADILKHPHTLEMDQLLDKFKRDMSAAELRKLQSYMCEELEDARKNGNASRQLVIILVMGRVQARIECQERGIKC